MSIEGLFPKCVILRCLILKYENIWSFAVTQTLFRCVGLSCFPFLWWRYISYGEMNSTSYQIVTSFSQHYIHTLIKFPGSISTCLNIIGQLVVRYSHSSDSGGTNRTIMRQHISYSQNSRKSMI